MLLLALTMAQSPSGPHPMDAVSPNPSEAPLCEHRIAETVLYGTLDETTERRASESPFSRAFRCDEVDLPWGGKARGCIQHPWQDPADRWTQVLFSEASWMHLEPSDRRAPWTIRLDLKEGSNVLTVTFDSEGRPVRVRALCERFASHSVKESALQLELEFDATGTLVERRVSANSRRQVDGREKFVFDDQGRLSEVRHLRRGAKWVFSPGMVQHCTAGIGWTRGGWSMPMPRSVREESIVARRTFHYDTTGRLARTTTRHESGRIEPYDVVFRYDAAGGLVDEQQQIDHEGPTHLTYAACPK